MNTILEVYNTLFQERLKAACIAGYELTKCKEQPCAWKQIYDPRLKNMKVSEKTLASILKIWQKTGTIEKVKAPFPYRSKYKLVEDIPEFELLRLQSDVIGTRSKQQGALLAALEFKQDPRAIPALQEIGKEAVKEWEWFSKFIFLRLIEGGLEGIDSEMSAYNIAFHCFLLVDYLLHSVANLFGESREEARRKLENCINSEFVKRWLPKEEAPMNEAATLIEALTLKP